MDKTHKTSAPLTERMRPRIFANFVGQEYVVGGNTLLRKAIEEDRIPSHVFWRPPGFGKTTLAHLIAERTKAKGKYREKLYN